MVELRGIEPRTEACKATIIPFNYSPILVGMTGFEPATFCSQSRRDTKLRYIPKKYSLARRTGVEPVTSWFVAKYSIQLSYRRNAIWRFLTDSNCRSLSCSQLPYQLG